MAAQTGIEEPTSLTLGSLTIQRAGSGAIQVSEVEFAQMMTINNLANAVNRLASK